MHDIPYFTHFVHINWQNRITHQNVSVNIDVYDVYLITCRHGRRTARSHIIYCGRFETVVLFRVCISIFFVNNSKIEGAFKVNQIVTNGKLGHQIYKCMVPHGRNWLPMLTISFNWNHQIYQQSRAYIGKFGRWRH